MALRKGAEFSTMDLLKTESNGRESPTAGDMNYRGVVHDELVELPDTILVKDLGEGVTIKGAYPSLSQSQKLAVQALKLAKTGKSGRRVEPKRGMVNQSAKPSLPRPAKVTLPSKPSLAPKKKGSGAGLEVKASKITGALKWTGRNVAIPAGIGFSTVELANRLQDRRNKRRKKK